MRNLLEKAPYIRLLIPDLDGVLTDGSLELLPRVRGTIDGGTDGNG